MKIAIVKYNAGNIQSVLYALERIGVTATVTDNPTELKSADKVIFPGVGEASSAMKYLRERKLDNVISELTQPVLGICLGMQLLCQHTEEGDTTCLGVFPAKVKLFKTQLKVPQIGWNKVEQRKSMLLENISDDPYCYFVHSYYAEPCEATIGVTNYDIDFSSALAKSNFFGVQFHAEKSAQAGEQMLRNFLNG